MLIRGKTLDLLILSLLSGKSTSMTGYSIVKAIEKQFYPLASPSPGTIYPRLKKMEGHGDIKIDNENSYSITDQGTNLLQKSVKGIVDNAFSSWSVIYKSLLHNISYPRRFHVMGNFGDFFGYNAETLHQCCKFSEDLSTEDLKESKKYLQKLKQDIQDNSRILLEDIDANLVKLDEMMEKKQETLKKPTIIWED